MKKLLLLSYFVLNTLLCYAQWGWGYPSYGGYYQPYIPPIPPMPSYYGSTSKKSAPIEEERQYESGGFEWIKLSQYNESKEEWYYGAKDENGKTIIPISRHYTRLRFVSEPGHVGYFETEKSGKEGVCDLSGSVILYPKYYSTLFCGGKFSYKNSATDDWSETKYGLSSKGRVTGKSSSGGSSWSDPYFYGTPQYSTYDGGNSYSSGSSGYSSGTISGLNPQQTLNQTMGENCLTCKGSGKCPTCNGTKIASGLGNTYKCNVCDVNGNCPSCHGSGKASWNR